MVTVQSWSSEVELSMNFGYLRHGIQYQNGRLIVPVTGTYFVHAFIDFYKELNRGGKEDNSGQPVTHGLYSFSVRDCMEKKLVTKITPLTLSRNKYFTCEGSYISSLVELQSGDEISVKVSDPSLLKRTGPNFFGLNLL